MKQRLFVLLTLLWAGMFNASAQVLRDTVVASVGPSGSTTFGFATVAIADVDGDGTTDFAISDQAYHSTSLQTLTPNGRVWVFSGATRQVITTIDPATGQFGFAFDLRSAGDANGDGRGDLVVSNIVPTFFTPIFNERILSVQPAVTLRSFTPTTNTSLNVWSIGDRNGDGRDDIAVRTTSTSLLNGSITDTLSFSDVLTNATLFSTSRTGTSTLTTGQFAIDGMALDDLDGDGLQESIYGSRTPTQDSRIELSASGATRIHSFSWSKYGRFDDLDGDGVGDYGILDLTAGPSINPSVLRVFSGATGAPLYVMTFTAGQIMTTLAEVHGVGDVDRDGLGDFAVSDMTPSFMLRVFSGRDGKEIMQLPPPPGRTFWASFAHLGDIDGDGIQEIVVGDRTIPQAYLYSLVPAGVTYFGTGCPSIGGAAPTLGVTGQALSGSGVDFHLGNVPPFGLGVLIIGVSNTFWGPIILPYDLGVIGLPGCDLLVSADFLDFAFIDAVGQKGAASFGYTFAAGLQLTGFTFFGQWFVENPPGSPVIYQMSDAASVTFQ